MKKMIILFAGTLLTASCSNDTQPTYDEQYLIAQQVSPEAQDVVDTLIAGCEEGTALIADGRLADAINLLNTPEMTEASNAFMTIEGTKPERFADAGEIVMGGYGTAYLAAQGDIGPMEGIELVANAFVACAEPN